MSKIFNKKTVGILLIAAITIPMLIFGVVEIIQPEDFVADSAQLGYPLYFFTLLGVAKIIGALLLIIPKVPEHIRLLGYAGFFFDFLFALLSWIVIGIFSEIVMPILFLVLLGTSYYLRFRKTK